MSTIEGLIGNQADTDYTVTPCRDGSYCCGNGTVADTCCKENRGLFLSDEIAVVREANSSASPISSSSSTSVPSSAVVKTSHQTGAIVGSAIGAAAGAALVTGIIFLIRMRRIKQQQPLSHENKEELGDNSTMRISPTHPELAANGLAPELEDSEETRRPMPELEDLTRSQHG